MEKPNSSPIGRIVQTNASTSKSSLSLSANGNRSAPSRESDGVTASLRRIFAREVGRADEKLSADRLIFTPDESLTGRTDDRHRNAPFPVIIHGQHSEAVVARSKSFFTSAIFSWALSEKVAALMITLNCRRQAENSLSLSFDLGCGI